MIKKEYFGYKFYLFPYEKIDKNEEVIIYGFGKVGKQYYWQLKSCKYCRIKGIIDRNYSDIDIRDADILSPDELEGLCDHKVIVSVQSGYKDIIAFLKRAGWKDDNIIWSNESILLPVCQDDVYTISEVIRSTEAEYLNEKGEDAVQYLRQVKECLKLYTLDNGIPFRRTGKHNDGGYLMINDHLDNEEKIAYSFGICDDVSWDSNMADKGYHIYMYDHTIDGLPYERKEFHFFKKGISDTQFARNDLETLNNLLEKNGHKDRDGMILKMDVEGAEYGFINSTDTDVFSKFDQIVMEYHDLLTDKGWDVRLSAMQKLLKTHVPVHIHANNLGDVLYMDDEVFADCIEVTYINRSKYSEMKESDGKALYLKGLDERCWPEMDEIYL